MEIRLTKTSPAQSSPTTTMTSRNGRNRVCDALPIDRRALLLAGATTGLVASSGLAQAQKNVASVPVEKLMAKGELTDITIGNAEAKVTIVEYASMTCPACANFHNVVYPKLKEKYVDTGKVKFVFREFPLDNLAVAVSMLARCAGGDKTVPMISLLFKTQPEWRTRNPVPKLLEISKQAGFTQASFEKCLDNQEMIGKLARQRDKASDNFGVDATPSFFINGTRFRGTPTFDALSGAIDPLLKG